MNNNGLTKCGKILKILCCLLIIFALLKLVVLSCVVILCKFWHELWCQGLPWVSGGSLVIYNHTKEESRRERVSDAIWETLKRTLILEENEANDSDEDVFFTQPNSPTDLKPTIIEPTPSALHCLYTPSRSKRLLNLHEKIVEELFNP